MPPAPLHRLLYVSRADSVGREFEILTEDVVAVSARNNAQVGVTGLLAAFDGWFLQALEGSRTEISATFSRIAKDPRHCVLELISAGPIDARLFGRWSMSARTITPAAAPVLDMLGARGGMDPRLLDSAGALRLLLTVARVSEGVLERVTLRA
ncbi:MAG: BLUF domain-containing protein [Proteobacteria bacterium]|nr:BLUF domain-containing protein [Pseudomonadota bacterium]MBW3617844.1 BLUF domain-containing protein [Pseudomonadota bacterium]